MIALLLAAFNWFTISGGGGTIPLSSDGSALWFEFPAPPNSINYLQTTSPPLDHAAALRFVVEVEAVSGTVFDWRTEAANICPGQAFVHALIDTGEPYTAEYPMGRWWYDRPLYLALAGRQDLTAVFDPAHWTDVFGIRANSSPVALAGFQAALRNARFVGLTFGGGCFYGHGVRVSKGSARFLVLGAYVLPLAPSAVVSK